MRRDALAATLAALSLLAGACAGASPNSSDLGDPDGSVVHGGGADTEPADWDDFPADEAREQARGLLGMNEADVPDDVRVSRRGDEQFALTEDYVISRRTVELDDTDGSGFRVVSVTIELPDGPETFHLEAG